MSGLFIATICIAFQSLVEDNKIGTKKKKVVNVSNVSFSNWGVTHPV